MCMAKHIRQMKQVVRCMPMLPEEDAFNSILQPIIRPWYESLENPQKAQEHILWDLLKKYAATEYGSSHDAIRIEGIHDYQTSFPIINYDGLLPYLAQAREGNY